MSFAAFGAMLATEGRVVTPTHPGFGGTERPDELASVGALATRYLQLLDELDLADVCLVGNSLGGWVAAEMAVSGSQRVTSVVLVNAVGIHVPGHAIPDVAALSPQELAQRAWHDPAKMPDLTTLPAAVQATLPGNRAALAVYGGNMQDPTLLTRLAAVTVPVLVAWGEADRIGDLDYGRAYAAAIPNARFEVVADAGHLPQIENPAALYALVQAFAREHSDGQPRQEKAEIGTPPGMP